MSPEGFNFNKKDIKPSSLEKDDNSGNSLPEKSAQDKSRREFLGALGGMILGGSKLVEAVARKVPRVPTKAELRGSSQSLDKQDLIALVEDLTPIRDVDELERFVKMRPPLMVPLPNRDPFFVAPNLVEEGRSYCRPWTANFLIILGNEWQAKFPNKHLKISSSVRPRNLGKVNRNASARSVHPTGNTIDISYIGMTPEEDKWMQNYLASWEHKTFSTKLNINRLTNNQNTWYEKLTKSRKKAIQSLRDKAGNVTFLLPKVEATREKVQQCFHFSVAKVDPFLYLHR